MVGGVGLDAPPTPVRCQSRGLANEQALLGGRRKEPAAAPFLYQSVVVGLRIEPEHRELEAVLARLFAVTSPAIAAELREERNDVGRKVNGWELGAAAHGYGNGAFNASILN